MTSITLAPLGAGLPIIERFGSRYLHFPFVSAVWSWNHATVVFRQERQKLMTLAAALSNEALHQRVLIARIRGIEDSSRHWSVAMTLEHLNLVNDAIDDIVPRLLAGETLDRVVKIEQVKPPYPSRSDFVSAFEQVSERYAKNREARPAQPRRSATLVHPWFGALSAHGWHCLAALHMGIHRRQVEEIVTGVG